MVGKISIIFVRYNLAIRKIEVPLRAFVRLYEMFRAKATVY